MRILQISDLHLPASPGALVAGIDTLAMARAMFAEIRQQHADLLVITGDVSADVENRFCYDFVVDELRAVPFRWLVLPGNHDRGTLFGQIFSRHTLTTLTIEESGEDAHLMFLDTSKESPDTAELETLASRLASARGTSCVFTHYPPALVGHPTFDRKHRLAWQEPLLAALQSSPGALHVFFGHIHYVFEQRLGNLHLYSVPSATMPTVQGVGADLPDPLGPSYRRIDVVGGRVSTTLDRLPHRISIQ